MIGNYSGPTRGQRDHDRAAGRIPAPRHRATQSTPTILRSATLPRRTRVWLFLVALTWHVRKAIVRTVVEAPAVVSEFRRTRNGQWTEDIVFALCLAAFGGTLAYAVATWVMAP